MNHINLANRCAIVTGGARGIGLAIVERLLASGAKVAIWDMDRKTAQITQQELLERYPGLVSFEEVDITDPQQVENAAASSERNMGRIDILVNNAGIAGVSKKLWECTPEEWMLVLKVDLFGVFTCCRAIIPRMLPHKYGRIVSIASIAGKEGNPMASHYSAAKAGVIGMTKSLGKELATTGILINCITPAVIETDILKQITQQHVDYMLSKIPMGRFGMKEEAAAMVAWLASEDCSFSTGAAFDLSGGRATY